MANGMEELRRDPKIAEVLGSEEAKELAAALGRLGGADLQAAARSAAAGDGAALQAILSKLMADPAGAKAVDGLRKKTGG